MSVSFSRYKDGRQAHPVADAGRAVLARLKGVDQGNNDSGARVSDGMSKCDGATVKMKEMICERAYLT